MEKHNTFAASYQTIPLPLQARRQWIVWRYQSIPGRSKPAKVPYTPGTTHKASTMNPASWGTYRAACEGVAHGFDGIGYVFAQTDPFFGLDQDGSVDTHLVSLLQTYAEFSPSGRGIHIIGVGKLEGRGLNSRSEGIELYDQGRFFTMTGAKIPDAPAEIKDCQQILNDLEQKYRGTSDSHSVKQSYDSMLTSGSLTRSDQAIIRKLNRGKQRVKFKRLWRGDTSDFPSHSESDFSLCNLIAWYTNDAAQIARIFYHSGLYRAKFDRADYHVPIIRRALDDKAKFRNNTSK